MQCDDSTYMQMCNDTEQELDAAKLQCQLCRAIDDIRAHCCYNSKSMFTASKEAREGLQRLATHIALRLGSCWDDPV